MKKSVSRGILILLVLAVAILPSVSAMAACNKPTSKGLTLYAPEEGGHQHYAIAKISVSKHAGQGGYDNSLRVGCHVRYVSTASGKLDWYDETFASANNASSVSRKQTVTPVLHKLVGADGYWRVTCNYCDVSVRKNDGSIDYKSV